MSLRLAATAFMACVHGYNHPFHKNKIGELRELTPKELEIYSIVPPEAAAHRYYSSSDDPNDHQIDDIELLERTGYFGWDVLRDDDELWVVKFYSPAGEVGKVCEDFNWAWRVAHEEVPGLLWATINVDSPGNADLIRHLQANKTLGGEGVLSGDGLPHVKILNAADRPLTVVSGGSHPAAQSVDGFINALTAMMHATGAELDSRGYYTVLSQPRRPEFASPPSWRDESEEFRKKRSTPIPECDAHEKEQAEAECRDMEYEAERRRRPTDDEHPRIEEMRLQGNTLQVFPR